ncbi:caspase family protein [Streptomyces sp900105245]|uniref:Caspase family protein n=1 Tax=Streptomyces sp. 900105245 TaxID=3154379 RepID=A0ABV1UKC0_9ACTN
MRQAAAEATDTLIVYFAGHGSVDADALSLALPDTEYGRIETSLPYDWLRQVLLLDSQAERHVVILDCCYSGLASGRMSPSPGLADQAAVEGSFLLAAAAETRTALAPVGDTYTAFTGALARHPASRHPGRSDFARSRSPLPVSAPHPGSQGTPRPAGQRNSGYKVALGRNHACLPAPPAPLSPGTVSGERPWPDPGAVRTVTGFFTALADVRVISGLTHQAVGERSAGRISAGTVSRLLSRTTLSTTWGTAAYLAACGVPDGQIARWQALWEHLGAQPATAEEATALPARPARAGSGRTRLWPRSWSVFGRERG